MQVTFYGVRGSTPCHGPSVARYGGNTSCVAIAVPDHPPVFLDLGTGARDFGHAQPNDGSFRGVCLLSHLHWDHAQGLPFFTPLHSAGAELDVYAPAQGDGRTVAEAIDQVICPPQFPVTVHELPGAVRFHDVGDEDFRIGEIDVTARMVPHVGPTLGFRLEWGGHSLAYVSDHQQPHDGSHELAEGVRELAEGVDLLIHDAQYLGNEFHQKRTWGHCTVDFALWVAERCRVRTLALFHHDPVRTDADLDELALEAVATGRRGGFDVMMAAEGLVVDLATRRCGDSR